MSLSETLGGRCRLWHRILVSPEALPSDTREADYVLFRELLREAVNWIDSGYFKTAVAGQSEEIFRERLFCYELYHQLRCACEKAEFAYRLGGELDKKGHLIIQGGMIPDLVVHEAGGMDRNLCVVEVKPITGTKEGFEKDVRILTSFTADHLYHAGILLVYGDHADPHSLIQTKCGVDFKTLRTRRISVLWIAHAQTEPVEL